jgi:hypothetical protein
MASLGQAAQSFLASYFGRWSEPNTTAMAYVQGIYAERVEFYGAPTGRETILDQKRKFLERWPERQYSVRPNSIKADCNERDGTCLISGLVDWNCYSAARGAHSAGLSDYSIRVVFTPSAGPLIIAERGSVLSRAP